MLCAGWGRGCGGVGVGCGWGGVAGNGDRRRSKRGVIFAFLMGIMVLFFAISSILFGGLTTERI